MSGGAHSHFLGSAKESQLSEHVCLSYTTCSYGWSPWEAISEVEISTQECSGGHYFGSRRERNRFRQRGKLSWCVGISSVQFNSVAQSCPTICDPMNHSMPGLPVHHHLPEFTETHVHRVRDAIHSSHSLSSPSPPAPNPSQHHSLFQWVNSLHEVALMQTGVSALASFLPKKSQGWSPSEWTGWIALQSKGLSRVFSNTTVQKHQFFGAQPSSQSNSHIHTWPQEKL